MSIQQAQAELAIATRFFQIAQLPIALDSIQNATSPAPDILCRHLSNGWMAFELVELCDQDFRHSVSRKLELESLMGTFYKSLNSDQRQRFDSRYDDVTLVFGFAHDITVRNAAKAIPFIFQELARYPADLQETVKFVSNHAKGVLDYVHVLRRRIKSIADFVVEGVDSLGDPTSDILRRKLTNRYETPYQAELVAYVDGGLMLPAEVLGAKARTYLDSVASFGPFRKVWVVDLAEERLALEYDAT